MSRLLAVALIISGFAQTNGRAEESRAEEFSGAIVVIESKDNSSVTIEHAQVRTIAGQSFIGGKVLLSDGSAAAKILGKRIWIVSSEVVRITELDAKAPVTRAEPAEEPKSEIAKIEALGGTVMRENRQTGGTIVSIDLSDNEKLTDEDLKLLTAFPQLQMLQLHGTNISDNGLSHIAGLTKLTYLGLIGAGNITDAGMKSLARLQELEELRVGNTEIGDPGLKELAKLKNLKMVGLIGTRVTEEGVKEFCEALPNVRHNLGNDGGGGGGGGGGSGGGQRTDPDFDTSVENPAYTLNHPSVLFDEAHQNFHTASGRYKAFANLMTNDGYQIVPNKDSLTPEHLAGHRVLVIANATANNGGSKSAFTEAECDAVEKWVKNGGSLLLITDHEPFGSGSQDLGLKFGVRMSLQVALDPAHEVNFGLEFSRDRGQIGNHPVMAGRNETERVNRVLTFTGQSLKGPAGSVALLKLADTATLHLDDSSAAGQNQGLALNYGKGRVVVMGEAGQLSAQVVGDPPERFGMNVPGCDNRKMAMNIMHWLSGLIDNAGSSPK